MTEPSWVRSVYLYGMCAASVALVLLGLTTTAVGLVHTIAPDLGHRDTLDRVGIGVSNIATDVIGIFDESQRREVESFCAEVTESEADFDACVDDEQAFLDDSLGSIEQGIADVKDELRNQIRNNSIDRMIRGLLMVVAGVLIFRIHGRRTELFADGLVPKRITPADPWAPTPPTPPTPPAPPAP